MQMHQSAPFSQKLRTFVLYADSTAQTTRTGQVLGQLWHHLIVAVLAAQTAVGASWMALMHLLLEYTQQPHHQEANSALPAIQWQLSSLLHPHQNWQLNQWHW